MTAQDRTDFAGFRRQLGRPLLRMRSFSGAGKCPPAEVVKRNFRIGCDWVPARQSASGLLLCRHPSHQLRLHSLISNDHETFSCEPRSLNFAQCFVSSSIEA